MNFRIYLIAAIGIISVGLTAPSGLCVGPFDSLLDEIGEPMLPPIYGQPGIDFADLQFIASFKPGYLTLPPGKTGAELGQCSVEKDLKNLLEAQGVYYVKQVFKGYRQGDTIRVIDSDTLLVPDLSQIYLLLQEEGSFVLDAIESMYQHEATLYAEPNLYAAIFATPNDEYWGNQWNLATGGFGIGCPNAWDETAGSSSVRLAILDTGIKWEHEDFGGQTRFPNYKVAGGWDYINGDEFPQDDYTLVGHGTQCAGIAAALTNNNDGVAGIAGGWQTDNNDFGSEIYALKILGESGHLADHATVARAIRDAADPDSFGCSILSNSWGIENCNTYSEVIRKAIHWVYRVGASFVAAKGNSPHCDDPSAPVYPADYGDRSWITAVGSYGSDGYHCLPVNCGYTSCYGNGIDISAPGHGIVAPRADGDYSFSFGGTSAACPHAAGSIALVRSLLSGLFVWNEDTDWILKYSAWDEMADNSEWTWDQFYGHGELRISTAIERISDTLGEDDWEFFFHFAEGGSILSLRSYDEFRFFGIGPLPAGTYSVIQYNVGIGVTYPESFQDVPYVWGIGVPSTGWSGANPNYQVGYCRVIPGSQTLTGCGLQTFVYEVYESRWGQFLGWYPCRPEEISLAYRLWGISAGGRLNRPDGREIHDESTPRELCFAGSYPNPFNATTSIEFGIPEDCQVSLTIYDLLGREVITLINGHIPAGYHTTNWGGKNNAGIDAPSGIYFYRLIANEEVLTRKVTMLK